MQTMEYPTMKELEEGLDYIRQSPRDEGVVQLIVRRPGVEEREIIEHAELDPVQGLIGDNWQLRGSRHTPDGSANPDAQITIMNSRLIELLAHEQGRWPLAGDQLYIDLDLSEANLPAGTRLKIGSAVLEVTSQPHTGCKKFSDRFGMDALKFISSPTGKELHLRGLNTRVVQAGIIRIGDEVRKVEATAGG